MSVDVWGAVVPAWLSGIGGVLAVAFSAVALVRATRAEERHVEWQQVAEEVEDGRKPHKFRLVNSTSGVTAEVLEVEDISDGLRDAVRNDLPVPSIVDPGGAIPLHIDRSLSSGYPTVVQVTWREGKPHRRLRKRTYRSTFYFQ